MKYKSMKKLLRLMSLFVLALAAQCASAQYYYWYASSYLPLPTKADDPYLSCQKYVQYQAENGPSTSTNYRISKFQYIAQTRYDCYYSFDVYNGVGGLQGTLTEYAKILRSGTSCPPDTRYNPTLGVCNTDEQKGSVPELACIGNPINLATGNKFQSETDYRQVGSGTALSFARSYNSQDGLWRHTYSTHLRFAGAAYVALVMADGRESFFALNVGTATPISADFGQLIKLVEGWEYTSTANERFTFDVAGRLTRWSGANGAVHALTYADGQVTVTDHLGNSLTFTEDARHQPLSLSAPGIEISYGYDANRRLVSVSRTTTGQTTQRLMHYEDPFNNALLTGITDERGVRHATWRYDDKGRAISSEHAEGTDRVGVAYNSDGTVSVTNELGKLTRYRFQTFQGVKRVTAIEGEPSANCPSSNSTFSYDSRGLLTARTDRRGVRTTYTYNERGLETSRTDAVDTPQARTITTEWHPSLFLPVVVTEPSRVIRYRYDPLGRRLGLSVETR